MNFQSETKQSKNDDDKTYRYRRILSQFLATTVKVLLIFEFGLCISFSGIIIAATNGKPNKPNVGETLSISGSQASWLGSVLFVFEPIGSLLSAVITDYLGRRRAMMIVNIPFAIAWFMMYKAESVTDIIIANSLLGFGIGLMEAPIMTYVGEICEPSIRSVLITYTNLGTPCGTFLIYFLNTFLSWRMVGLICMSVPITTMILLYFVPETPHWLLSKGFIDQAEKSLCWLRGWVSKDHVATEFERLQQYSDRAKSCDSCIKQHLGCSHPPPGLVEKFSEFKRKRTLKPFIIVIALFVILQFSGIFAMTPYLMQIFRAYKSPIAPDAPDVIAVVLSFMNIFATITFMCFVRFVGKRRIYLTVLSGVCISSFIVSVYGFIFLPKDYTSLDPKNEAGHLDGSALAYIPTCSLIIWSFCSYCGILMMPWQMLSEIFSFRTRGLAAGVAAAINYIMCFASTKTYYNLETSLSMPGIAMFYCVCATLGLILMFNIMPETEGRSLEDIELHFLDDGKKITDWYIPQRNEVENNKTQEQIK